MNRIFLTAGHHLNDSGAVANNYKENQLNIELRDLIAKRIIDLNPVQPLWIDNDKDTLSQVINKVSKIATPKDIWLEIHFDASINPKASGCTALVAENAREASKSLAKQIADIGATILNIPNRGVKSEKQSARGYLGMLHTKATSVLYEVAFISNPTDMANNQNWKHWLADEIARILLKAIK